MVSASNKALAQKGAQALRSPPQQDSRVGSREMDSLSPSGDLDGQETLARLRSLQVDGVSHDGSHHNGHVNKSIALERASAENTKDWEDEKGSERELDEEDGSAVEKLVDIE